MPGKKKQGAAKKKSEFGLGKATGRGTSTIKQLYMCLGIVSRVTIDIKVEKEGEASSGRWGGGGGGGVGFKLNKYHPYALPHRSVYPI